MFCQSTNPTNQHINTIDNDIASDVCTIRSQPAGDVAFAESRIRGETIAAENHTIGRDQHDEFRSQPCRIGEVITRSWQTADR